MPERQSLAARLGEMQARLSISSGDSDVDRADAADVLSLAMPLLGEQVVLLSVSMVDTSLVGHLGAVAMGAGGLANQFVVFANMMFGAVAAGSAAVVARAVGARNITLGNRVLGQANFLALVVGVTVALAFGLMAPSLLWALGASGEVASAGIRYLRQVSLGFPLASLMLVGNGCLRAAGNTVTPLRISLAYSVTSIAVAWVFVRGAGPVPPLGLTGSALGQICGYSLGGLLVVSVLARGRLTLRLDPRFLLPNPREIWRIVRVASPAIAEQVLMRLGHLTFIRFMVGLGTTGLAAHLLVMNAQSLPYMPGAAFGLASAALVGQSLGANSPERASRIGYRASLMSMGVMGLFALLFCAFPEWVMGLFTNDAEIISAGAGALRLSSLMQIPMALLTVFALSLRGAGDTRWPMLINGLGLWLFRVPAGFVVGVLLRGQVLQMWVVIVVDMMLRSLLAYLRFHHGGWKRVRV